MSGAPSFGRAAWVCNVIDTRQSYLQKLLKQALIAVGNPEGAERSHLVGNPPVDTITADGWCR